MASFAYFVTLATSLLLLGEGSCEGLPINPICRRSDTTDVATLERCLDTTIFAIRAVSNASNDFDEACPNLDDAQAADQGLDIEFLKYQVCGKFGGQGQFYGNTDDAITSIALLKVALEVAADDDTDPVLRYICRGLDLSLYSKFQLSADTIYDIACGGLYIPAASSSASSSSVSTTTATQSSSSSTLSPYSLTTPSTYSASTNSWPSGYSSTSCTTSSSSSSIAVHRRQADTDDVDFWIKVIDSALWALGLIESDEDDERCEVGDYWIDQWNSMGYFGDYVQALICASAANNTLFPPRTIIQARASLITTLRGIILARDDPTNLARKIACDNLSYAILVQAEFDVQDITAIINFVCYLDGSPSESSSDGPISSTTSSASVATIPSSITATMTSASLSSASASVGSTRSSTSSGPTPTSSSSASTPLNSTTSASSSTSTSSSASTSSSSTTSASSSSSTSSSSTTSASSSSSTSSSSTTSASSSSSTSSSTSTSSSSTTSAPPSLSSISSSKSLSSSTAETSSSTTSTSSSGSLFPSFATSSTSASSASDSTTTSTTSSSSSASSIADPNSTTSSSSSSYSSPPCSYVYGDRGYYYSCSTTTLDTSYSTTGTPRSY